MTDTVTFYRNIIAQTNQFIQAYEAMALLADRISSDSSLSAAAAASANASGRTDLSTADFDNFNSAVDVIVTLMNSHNSGVNAATVKLSFYKML